MLCNNKNFMFQKCIARTLCIERKSYIVQKALPKSHIFFKSAVNEENYGRAKNVSTLIISVYLPKDPLTIHYNDQELMETLGVIQNVLETNFASQVILT